MSQDVRQLYQAVVVSRHRRQNHREPLEHGAIDLVSRDRCLSHGEIGLASHVRCLSHGEIDHDLGLDDDGDRDRGCSPW